MSNVEWEENYGSIALRNSHFALQTSHFSRAGVVAERAFVAQGLGRVNVAFDDEGGRWAKRFSIRAKCFQGSVNPASICHNELTGTACRFDSKATLVAPV